MSDFQPGYPEDRRLPKQRDQATRNMVGDFEFSAARVIARLTGDHVILQDDNSKQRMPDIKIAYAGRDAGYAEVTLDIAPRYAAMSSAVRRRGYRIPASPGRMWWATLSSEANVAMLEQSLPHDLACLERAGHVFEIVEFDQRLIDHANPLVRQLAVDGVVGLASRSLRADETAYIHIGPEGTGGEVRLDWDGRSQVVSATQSLILCDDHVSSQVDTVG